MSWNLEIHVSSFSNALTGPGGERQDDVVLPPVPGAEEAALPDPGVLLSVLLGHPLLRLVLLQPEEHDQWLGHDPIEESGEDNDEDGGDLQHLGVFVFRGIAADHHVGHSAPEAAKEDDSLPLEVYGLSPESVENKDQSHGDHQTSHGYGEEHDEAEL